MHQLWPRPNVAVAMNAGTQAAQGGCHMVHLDSNPPAAGHVEIASRSDHPRCSYHLQHG